MYSTLETSLLEMAETSSSSEDLSFDYETTGRIISLKTLSYCLCFFTVKGNISLWNWYLVLLEQLASLIFVKLDSSERKVLVEAEGLVNG